MKPFSVRTVRTIRKSFPRTVRAVQIVIEYFTIFTIRIRLTVLDNHHFSLEEMPFVAENNHLSFTAELSKMNKMPETRHANILIVPPDKSMAFIQDKENVCLLDSHCHKDKGGLIMTCNVDNFELFSWVVQTILKRDFNSTLEFANLSLIKLNM